MRKSSFHFIDHTKRFDHLFDYLFDHLKISRILPLDVFTTEFVICLGDAEQVRRKFGGPHVVQDLFVFLEPLNFLLPGFNSKICLTKGNHFFAGVSVHHNQVTSVTGKLDIGDFTPGTFSEGYHFADVGKMVPNI